MHSHTLTLTSCLVVVASAFQARPSSLTSSITARWVGGMGWDNDNFLDSLGKGTDARAQANDEYYQSSRFGRPDDDDDDDDDDFRQRAAAIGEDLGESLTTGAELTEEMRAKMKASHTEEESQGGKMFRQLMARAQEGPRQPPPSYSAPQVAAAAPATPSVPDFNSLSVEQQAELFRQMMQQQQQPYPPPQPQYQQPQQFPPGGAALSPDGRPYGRNRDAEAVVNTSDLYFAQLKVDSSSRNRARYSGNEEEANAVFTDPRIKELKIQENPYTAEQRKKEREMYETIPEEMLLPGMSFEDKNDANVDKSYAGVSYKKLLDQKRRKGPAVAAADVKAESVAPQAPLPPQTQVPPPQPETAPPQAQRQKSVPSLQQEQSSEDFRKDTRALMGLTLKHRGGPGFGVGRLQGSEIERFGDLASNFMETVKQEAAVKPEGSGAPVAIPEKTVPASNPGASLLQEPEEPPAATQAFTPPTPGSLDMNKADSMVACVEGAIQVYRNSPPQLLDTVMVTLRAALLSAVNTCNELLSARPNSEMTAPASPLPNAEAMVSCLEGAIQMYRNSPVELRETVLLTLRAALLSAVVTCNELVPDDDNASPSAAPAAFPSTVPSTAPSYSGNDPNSQMLNDIYERLKTAAGDGKMGLREDLTPEEAQALSNDLNDMRALLVDELENGIPEEEAPVADAQSSTTSTKYSELLAKAKAAKGQ